MPDGPARLGFVTGHLFGRRALEGIASSTPFLDGVLDVPLIVTLDGPRRAGVVGSSGVDGIVPEARVLETSDGSLASCLQEIDDAALDYLVVVGWSRLVSPEVLGRFPSRPLTGSPLVSVRAVGMHPSPLPVGRGQAPIPWTIIKGLRRTALSVFGLEAAADAGAVVDRLGLVVRSRETAASLFNRHAHLHFLAGGRLAEYVASGQVLGSPQDDREASVWPRRRPRDSELDGSLTVVEADAHVRALLGPYPRAFVLVDGAPFFVEATSLHERRPSPAWSAVPYGFSDGTLTLFGASG